MCMSVQKYLDKSFSSIFLYTPTKQILNLKNYCLMYTSRFHAEYLQFQGLWII